MNKVEIKKIQKGLYYEVYVEVSSMGKMSKSQKIGIPPIVKFTEDSFEILTLPDLEKNIPKNNYFVGSGDFSRERLLNLNTSNYLKYFENFPVVERYLVGNEWHDHPISSMISELEINLKPSKELEEKMNSMSYIESGKFLSSIIHKHKPLIESTIGYKLDLYSIPKRNIGECVYLADDSGVSFASRIFNFGFVNTFPVDRVTREIKSLRQAEPFLEPYHPVEIFPAIKPFTSFLRVAIVKTKDKMLDGGDLFPTGQAKVACNLSKIHHDTEFSSLNDKGVVYKVNRGSIDVWRETVEDYDERIHGVGPCRLVLPGGVKICADPRSNQPYYKNKPIDLLIDFRTIADKGALGLFSMESEKSFGKKWTYEEALETFHSRPTQKIHYNGDYLEGYVCLIPVFRPRQRHTEICKTSTNTMDLVSYAILNKRMIVPKQVEKNYSDLRLFRESLEKEIARHYASITNKQELVGVSE